MGKFRRVLYSPPVRQLPKLTDQQLDIVAKNTGIDLNNWIKSQIRAATAMYFMIVCPMKNAQSMPNLKPRVDKFKKAAKELKSVCGYNDDLVKTWDSDRKKIQELFQYTLPRTKNSPNAPFEILGHALDTCIIAADWLSAEIKKSKFEATEKMAWNFWIQSLVEIMKRHELPHQVSKGQRAEPEYRPSGFVNFVWELEKQLPSGFVRSSATKLGLADAIVRALNSDVGDVVERFFWPEVREIVFNDEASEEKREPASDTDAVVADRLKALDAEDPERPI
jgi:hypothetical protein